MRVRTKICGLTTVPDARAAVGAGADAIGLVFAPSPRQITLAQAADICAVLPPFVTKVGLFVDADAAAITEVLADLPIDLLQFQGQESPSFCESFGKPYVKALAVRDGFDFAAAEERYCGAAALLLDAYQPGKAGGTGKSFDWSMWPANSLRPLILAGGLTPENVRDAIRQTAPYAVDVSSGVERDGRKGSKDPGKIQRFIEEVGRGTG